MYCANAVAADLNQQIESGRGRRSESDLNATANVGAVRQQVFEERFDKSATVRSFRRL